MRTHQIDYKAIKAEKELRRQQTVNSINANRKEYDKNRSILKYGISLEEYNHILKKQDFCCAICKKHMSDFDKRLFIDHNHETGKVRGLLCYSFNIALGHFEDSINNLQKAIEYLKSNI